MTTDELIRAAFILLFLFLSGTALCAETVSRAIDDAIAASDYEYALDLIDRQLETNGENPSLLFKQARVLGYSGEPDMAISILDRLRRMYPHDVDYALARAQTLAGQRRDAEALDDLGDAVILAPHYEEVWRLQYTLLSRQQGKKATVEYEAFLQKAALRFPNAAWWQAGQNDSVVQWSILAGAGYQRLSNGQPSWSDQFFEVNREEDPWGRYRIGVARNERFDNADISMLLGGDFTFASDWLAGVAVSIADDADFQPDLDLNANVGRSLNEGWVLNLRYRHRKYQTTSVTSATGVIEKYLGNYRVAYAMGFSSLPGTSTLLSHGLTVNWYYDDDASLGVTINSGKEAELIGPGQVLETSVRGLSLGGRQQLTDRFGLQWWLGLHDQGDYYRRDYFGLAVSIQL